MAKQDKYKDISKDQRIITLIQLDTDRAEWVNFLEAVKKLGYLERTDFFPNPTGNPTAMFKAYAANDPKLKELRKKYNVQSFGIESVTATDFKRSHMYEAGNKVKIFAGGAKEIVAEVVATSFGESEYKLKLTDGTIVHRNAHEMKPFLESEDRERNADVDSTHKDLDQRRIILGREADCMDIDEMVDEAMTLADMDENVGGVEVGYSACCHAPMTAEDNVCPACGKEAETIPVETENMGDAAYPICTKSVGSTAGTTKRSNWDADDKERYDRCIDHLEEDDQMELTEDADPIQGMDRTELMSYDIDEPFQESLNEYKDSEILFVPLKSSFIRAAAYDETEHLLYIRFQTGVYEYHKVPKNVFDMIQKAPSVGKFFLNVIKPNFVYNLAKKYKKRGAINTNPIPTSEMTEDDNDNYAETGKYQSPERFKPNHDFFGEGESEIKAALETLSDDLIEELCSLKGVEYKGREGSILSLTDYSHLTVPEIEDFKAANTHSTVDDIVGEAMDSFTEDDNIGAEVEGENEEESIGESVTIEETFVVSQEDRDTMSYLAEAKGWKVNNFTGLLKEGKHESLVRIVCEKKGVTAIITYDDDAISKPWTWEGRKFNFLQEALDTVFIPLKQALNEAVKKEKADIKSKEKQVKFLTERRGEAYKTTDLSKEEQAYRDAKGADAFKKFMGDDLLKRGF